MLDLTDYLRLEVDVSASGKNNLVLNPSGELGSWFWITTGSDTLSSSGTTLSFTNATPASTRQLRTAFMPLAAGKWISARVELVSLSTSYSVKFKFYFYDVDQVLITSTTQSAGTNTPGVKYYGNFQAPTGTAYVKYEMEFVPTGTPAGPIVFKQAMVTWRDANDFSQVVTNLVTNPSVETNLSGWTFSAGTGTRVSGSAWQGTYKINFVSSGSYAEAFSPSFPVTELQPYTVSAMVRTSTGTANARVRINFYDANGNTLGMRGTSQIPINTTYQQLTHTATVYEGAVTAKVSIQIDTGTAFIDGVMATAGSTVMAFFDGSTTSTGSTTYAWTGTANNSTSTATTSSYDYLDPGNWTDLFGPTSSISTQRQALDVGLMNFSVETSEPVDLDVLNNGQAIRLTALVGSTWTPVFTGTVTSWNTSYYPTTRVDIQATDAVTALASRAESRGVAAIADLPWLLEKAGVPWSINGNGNQVASATQVSSNPNATVLDQVAITRDSTNSYAWVDPRGVLTVKGTRDTTTLSLSDVAGTGVIKYSPDLEIGESSERVINNIMVTYLRYNTYTKQTTEVKYGPYRDNASIAKYGPKSATFTIHGVTETSVSSWATATLAKTKDTVPMPSSVTIPITDTSQLAALNLDLNMLVNFTYKTFTGAFAISSISHSIAPGSWKVTLGFEKQDGVASPTIKPVAEPNYPEDTPHLQRYKAVGSAQSIPNSADTRITFPDTDEQTGVTWSSNQATIGRAGRYLVDVLVSWDASTAGKRTLNLYAGGKQWSHTAKGDGSAGQTQSITKTIRLTTGDLVYAEANQNSGAALNIQATRQNASIELTWIGD